MEERLEEGDLLIKRCEVIAAQTSVSAGVQMLQEACGQWYSQSC